MKMRKSGTLRKMDSRLENPVQYGISLDEKQIPLNPLIGSNTKLVFTGNIFCIECGRKTKKSFNQGYFILVFRNSNSFLRVLFILKNVVVKKVLVCRIILFIWLTRQV